MNIKKLITVGVAGMAMGVMALDYVEVTDVKARQRYPWNGLVDIDFELDSKATEPYQMQVTVVDNVGKTNLPVKTVYTEGVSIKNNPCMVTKDTSRILWDAAVDLPDGFKCTNVLVTCQDTRSIAVSNRYMIIDISGGSSASSYPVTYTNCPPEGGWTEEHMTTKIVLRRIEPGSFLMGSPIDEAGHQSNESLHKVTLTKPYYISVYAVTTKQYAQVCGGSGSDTKLAVKGWYDWRGADVSITEKSSANANGNRGATIDSQGKLNDYAWPNSSKVVSSTFLGKIRSRAGVSVDFPTEAQWENACRAGSQDEVNIGGGNTSANQELMVVDSRLDATGSHYLYSGCGMPNAYGLYDMNRSCWCLDIYVADLKSAEKTNPVGGSGATEKKTFGPTYGGGDNDYWTYIAYGCRRVIRGGSCRSAARTSGLTLNLTGAMYKKPNSSADSIINNYITKNWKYDNPTAGARIVVTVEE